MSLLVGAQGPKTGTPLDDLPPYIKVLLDFGERPEWGSDGRAIYFLEKSFGDVYVLDLQSNRVRPVTAHFPHEGFARVLRLSNGDLLLCGNRVFDAAEPMKFRHRLEMWVLDKSFRKPPVSLGEFCDEGPAVSRRDLKIAWTAPGQREIYLGEIDYSSGRPVLAGKKLLIAQADPEKRLETQDFRSPDDRELIFTAYAGTPDEPFRFSEVMGYDLRTSKITNYSLAPDSYDEPEGIFPDGKSILVESDRHFSERNWKVDLYRLSLDGSGKVERLLRFTDWPGYISDNGVVSPDGRHVAFQMGIPKLGPGEGSGLLLLDLDEYERSKRP